MMRISEILGVKGRRYQVRDIFGFRQTGVRKGAAIGEFYATGHLPHFLPRLSASGIDLPPELFAERLLGKTDIPNGEDRRQNAECRMPQEIQ